MPAEPEGAVRGKPRQGATIFGGQRVFGKRPSGALIINDPGITIIAGKSHPCGS